MADITTKFLGLDLIYGVYGTDINLMYGVLMFNKYAIRVFGTLDSPWFCGKDVCHAMGIISHKRVLQKLNTKKSTRCMLLNLFPSEDIKKMAIEKWNISSNELNTTFINESGLYRIICRTTSPNAESFQDWVYDEVLPSIRKHGKYILTKEITLLKNTINEVYETPRGHERVWVPGGADIAAIQYDVHQDVKIPLSPHYWKWYIHRDSWAYTEVMEKWGPNAADRVYIPNDVNPDYFWEYGLIYDDESDSYFYNKRYRWSPMIKRILELRE